MKNGTYQALVGEETFEITIEGDTVTVDGEPVECTFEKLGERRYLLLLEGKSYPLVIEASAKGSVTVMLAGRDREVKVKDERALLLERFGLAGAVAEAEVSVRAPMPGLVLDVLVEAGQEIEQDAGLLVLEAMKMENELRAPAAGVVKAVHVSPGDAVGKNDLLVEFEAADG